MQLRFATQGITGEDYVTSKLWQRARPDCLCARLSGTVQALERAVRLVEAAPSLAAAVREERCEIELPGVLRFFGRRVRHTHRALQAIKGLYPQTFAAVLPTVTDFARVLGVESAPGVESVLVHLRQIASQHLAALPAPLGFNPVRGATRQRPSGCQHRVGPDPPIVLVEARAFPGNRPGESPQPEDADR